MKSWVNSMKTLMPMQEMDENFHPVIWCPNTLKDPKKKKKVVMGFLKCCCVDMWLAVWNQHPPGHLGLETGVWLRFSWTTTELPTFYHGNTYHVNFHPCTMKVGK
jgi:hypothetical protein